MPTRLLRLATCLLAAIFALDSVALSQATAYHRETTPMAIGRQLYGAAVVGDWLYVIGGYRETDQYTKSVERAKIGPRGELGPWEETTPLPTARSYINNTTLVLGGAIYVVQGLEGATDAKLRTVAWTRPLPDGGLLPWRESAECPDPGVSCAVAVASGGRLHLIGGSLGSSVPTDKVWTACLDAEGAVTAWVPGPALPEPRWFHSAAAVRGRVYVWGGLTSSSPDSAAPSVLVGEISALGDIGTWKELPAKLDFPHYSASCAVSGDYLFSFCPRYPGGVLSGDIVYAVANADDVSPWTKLEAGIPSKYYSGVAADRARGLVFMPGGRFDKKAPKFDKKVYVFDLAKGSTPARPTEAAPPRADAPAPAQAIAPAPAASLGDPSGAWMRFVSFDVAKKNFNLTRRPLAVVFLKDGDPASDAQRKALAEMPTPDLPQDMYFAAVDVATEPAVAAQMKVTATPHWIFYDAAAAPVVAKPGLLEREALLAAIKLVKP